jgi:hypothetical protein
MSGDDMAARGRPQMSVFHCFINFKVAIMIGIVVTFVVSNPAYSNNKHTLLGRAIDALGYTYPTSNDVFNRRADCSAMEELCSGKHATDAKSKILGLMETDPAIACCKPMGCRYIYNVQIANGRLVLFTGTRSSSFGNESQSICWSGDSNGKLPVIPSTHQRQTHSFSLPIETRADVPFPPQSCRRIVNGTLHVLGERW